MAFGVFGAVSAGIGLLSAASGLGAPLVLGGFVFQDFEIPESLALGGSQAGHMHKLPGGVRIFDASGPDDDNISWTGRFRGAGAQSRALQLASMRRAGAVVPLFAMGLAYSVLIDRFTFTIKRPYEIDYSITLHVIEDQTQGVSGGLFASLDTMVASDIAAGAAFLGAIDAASNAAFGAFTAAVSLVSSLQEAGPQQLGPARLAAFSMLEAIEAAQAAEDAEVLANPLGASPIDTGASGLLGTRSALENEVSLLTAFAYLGRAAANIGDTAG